MIRLAASDGDAVHEITIDYARTGLVYRHLELAGQLSILDAAGGRLRFALGGRIVSASVARLDADLQVMVDGRHCRLRVVDRGAHAAEAAADSGGLAAPMAGKVVALRSVAGARVVKGAALLVLEAMKMEHTVVAPADGTVDGFLCAVGDQVAEGAALVSFTPG